MMKLLVRTRAFFDPDGEHYAKYTRFYKVVKALNNIVEKTEAVSSKKEEMKELIQAVRKAELIGKALLKDNPNKDSSSTRFKS